MGSSTASAAARGRVFAWARVRRPAPSGGTALAAADRRLSVEQGERRPSGLSEAERGKGRELIVEGLHEDLAMPAFKHDGKAGPSPFCAKPAAARSGSEEIAERLGAPAQRQPARGGDADAHAGEAARPG